MTPTPSPLLARCVAECCRSRAATHYAAGRIRYGEWHDAMAEMMDAVEVELGLEVQLFVVMLGTADEVGG